MCPNCGHPLVDKYRKKFCTRCNQYYVVIEGTLYPVTLLNPLDVIQRDAEPEFIAHKNGANWPIP